MVLVFWNPADDKSITTLFRLEKAVGEAGDKVGLVRVDMSRKKRIAQRYNVTASPTVLLINKGKVIRNLSSELDDESFKV